MEQVGKTNRFRSLTVNSKKINSLTVNSNSTVKRISDFLEGLSYSDDDIAHQLANGLGDQKSLAYYQMLAKNIPAKKLLEAFSYVKDAENRGVVKFKPVYFQAILRNWGYPIKFRR
ncbi:MAG: hypothetical protein V1719_02755 [Patescibacteria group bacterium]